tara:strand:+ start:25 stop:357 length:333 start_codon:yes stop_codon:yes gene_type:complete
MSNTFLENMYKESLENRNEKKFRVAIQGYSIHNNTGKIKQGYNDFPEVFENEWLIEQISKTVVQYDNLELANFFLENNIQNEKYPLKLYVIFYKKSCPTIYNDFVNRNII